MLRGTGVPLQHSGGAGEQNKYNNPSVTGTGT